MRLREALRCIIACGFSKSPAFNAGLHAQGVAEGLLFAAKLARARGGMT